GTMKPVKRLNDLHRKNLEFLLSNSFPDWVLPTRAIDSWQANEWYNSCTTYLRRKDRGTMAEQVIKTPYHQFTLSNNDALVVRCCSRCGLSHLLSQHQRTYAPMWTLIPEEKGDTS